jgi:hypothetical protein
MAVGNRKLAKLVGGEKVPLPKGEPDSEGWQCVCKALGRPAKSEDYQLPDLESAAPDHKLGRSWLLLKLSGSQMCPLASLRGSHSVPRFCHAFAWRAEKVRFC